MRGLEKFLKYLKLRFVLIESKVLELIAPLLISQNSSLQVGFECLFYLWFCSFTAHDVDHDRLEEKEQVRHHERKTGQTADKREHDQHAIEIDLKESLLAITTRTLNHGKFCLQLQLRLKKYESDLQRLQSIEKLHEANETELKRRQEREQEMMEEITQTKSELIRLTDV
ncbi:MAG: hypothetical protein EZS28_005721, partial [Streblomastix strix]